MLLQNCKECFTGMIIPNRVQFKLNYLAHNKMFLARAPTRTLWGFYIAKRITFSGQFWRYITPHLQCVLWKKWPKRLLKDAFACNHSVYRDAELCSGWYCSSRNERKVGLRLETSIANKGPFWKRWVQITRRANNAWSVKRSWMMKYTVTVRLRWNWKELINPLQTKYSARAYCHKIQTHNWRYFMFPGYNWCTCLVCSWGTAGTCQPHCMHSAWSGLLSRWQQDRLYPQA